MTLTIIGTIYMSPAGCLRCNSKISPASIHQVRCKDCGAYYEYTGENLVDKKVNYHFEFKEYRCIHIDMLKYCNSACPSPNMYCKKHISDEHVKKVKTSISHAEKLVDELKDKLDTMKESKRLWLINKVSGIDE